MLAGALVQSCRLIMAIGLCLMIMAGLPGAAAARDLPPVRPVMTCSALAESDVRVAGEAPGRIVTAQLVTTGTVAPYCDVRGYVSPQVRFALRLPTMNWMQRLMFSGCGGLCGRVEFRVRAADGCAAVDNGEFAMVTSDLGHDTPDGNGDAIWAADNRQGKIDYGYRAVHVVTVVAKAIVARFYGQPQAYAYFNGCSDGGREAMMEVQRYPNDFDGVIAGAAVIHDVENNTIYHAWMNRHLFRGDGTARFGEGDLAVLHKAAVATCASQGKGVADGLILDPAGCRFDPAIAACTTAKPTDCLTADQVDAARAIYAGPHDRSGKGLYFGRPVGSELMWNVWSGPALTAFVKSFANYLLSDTPQDISLADISYEADSLARFGAFAPIYNATNADISAFVKAGGKLIMWHGWADPAVPPMSSVDYHARLRDRFGPAAEGFVRLFMLPGVGHCGGGEGPDKVNFVDPILAWVEDGVAPQQVEVSLKTFGRTRLARVVRPYTAATR